MERVSIIPGKLPILVIAPHGFDENDERTAIMVEYMANTFGFYAVINRGWERSDTVDYMLDKADCNDVNHCHEDVVREEFLEPIIRYKERILQKSPIAQVFYLHGMHNRHRVISGDPQLDLVIGFGAGSPNSFTCDIWRKDLFVHLLDNAGMQTYEGSKGGPMSGWARGNMNQLFRKWYPQQEVQSMQIEVIYALRDSTDIALITADFIGQSMLQLIGAKSFSGKSNKTY